jgi:bifunctional non-homologous end joining protein LigD
LLTWKDGPRVRLWTRQATDVTARFAGITAGVARLPVEDAVLDGEAVTFRPDGHSDFHGLLGPGWGREAVIVAFDLLAARFNLRSLRIEDRRNCLQDLVQGYGHPNVLVSQTIKGDCPTIFEHACKLGAGGIISKRRESICGQVDTWRKIKHAGFVSRQLA